MDSEKGYEGTGRHEQSIKEIINVLKQRARGLKKNVCLLYLAYKHPKTPWYAKVLAAMVVAYALSPIDLVPDFIPVIGYLDDLLIIPGGIALAIKLIPKDIMEECGEKINNPEDIKRKGIYAGVVIVLIWIIVLFLIIKKYIFK